MSQRAPSQATPAYPPPSACAVSAEQTGTARWTISGTGFIPRQAVALTSSGVVVARPVTNAAGSFRLVLALPASSGRYQISAAGSGCATSVSVKNLPPRTSESPAPAVGPVIPSLLPRDGLQSGWFLGLIAAVIVLGIGLLTIASRGGHRKAG